MYANLLSGKFEDAAVYKLNDDRAIIEASISFTSS
jgi:hypothetical protein